MSLLNTLKIGGRTALVALVLGGTAFSAMPAQAAGFSFNFGNGVEHNGVVIQFGNGHFQNNYCLSTSEIRSQLRHAGYRDVQIIRSLSHQRVLAVGRKGSSWYQLIVNACTGAVDVQKIRRSNSGSFSFSGGGFDRNGDHSYSDMDNGPGMYNDGPGSHWHP